MKNPEKLLDLLAQDARLTPAQLAAMLGETEEDVAAAIKAYQAAVKAHPGVACELNIAKSRWER